MNLIGHETTKKQIKVAQQAARARNMSLPHMLFSGSPGCGKTTMANEIAKTSGVDFITATPEDLKDAKSVKKLLENLNDKGYDAKGNRISNIKPSIIFLDEIHNIPLKGQEILGIAMENFRMETGRPNAYYWLPYFTLIGATTLAGNLSKPFLDRFKLSFMFSPYSTQESIKIIRMHAQKLKISMTAKAVNDIAVRGRGVPRIMVSYLERVRDAMIANKSVLITSLLTKEVFEAMGIDIHGFSETEIKILMVLYKNDIPVGLENLSIITNESTKTIKERIEPYLIQSGLMMRSGSGRIITKSGREYLENQGYTGKASGKQYITANYERS